MDEHAAIGIQEELQRVRAVLEDISGVSSRWNGKLYLVENAPFYGRKPFECYIELSADLAHDELRWRTLIHELLHSMSAGYNQPDYNLLYGWEEGVVEQLQRLFRPAILSGIGISINEQVFNTVEAEYPYNKYIAALQQIREAVREQNEVTFYLQLLQTPIKDRSAKLLQTGIAIGGEEGKRIISAVSKSRAMLERKLTWTI